MQKLIINGGNPLFGQVEIQGAKNSVLPILAACFLTEEPCVIENCPNLSDVKVAFEILRNLGCNVEYKDNVAYVSSKGEVGYSIPDSLMRRMRSSVMFLGAIIGRCGRACISYPGGCELGARPIDIHLKALTELGCILQEEGGYINCTLEKFVPKTISFTFPSVGATENILLLSAVSQGETILVNPAREPEIVDLQNFLNSMGAKIQGAGTDCIKIEGVKKLYGCRYSVMPDRIVTATYACGCVACGGEVCLLKAEPKHCHMLLSVLKGMGADIRECRDSVEIGMKKRAKAVPYLKTLPYPGFPTDMQGPLMASLLTAEGTSVICETIFENRFKHVGEFVRMGADIRVDGTNAVIRGVKSIHGAEIEAADLRGGAALVIGGLCAQGQTCLSKTMYIDRGYEDICKDFRDLGGNIKYSDEN